jgi:hypothetical protein
MAAIAPEATTPERPRPSSRLSLEDAPSLEQKLLPHLRCGICSGPVAAALVLSCGELATSLGAGLGGGRCMDRHPPLPPGPSPCSLAARHSPSAQQLTA